MKKQFCQYFNYIFFYDILFFYKFNGQVKRELYYILKESILGKIKLDAENIFKT